MRPPHLAAPRQGRAAGEPAGSRGAYCVSSPRAYVCCKPRGTSGEVHRQYTHLQATLRPRSTMAFLIGCRGKRRRQRGSDGSCDAIDVSMHGANTLATCFCLAGAFVACVLPWRFNAGIEIAMCGLLLFRGTGLACATPRSFDVAGRCWTSS